MYRVLYVNKLYCAPVFTAHGGPAYLSDLLYILVVPRADNGLAQSCVKPAVTDGKFQCVAKLSMVRTNKVNLILYLFLYSWS